MNRTRLAQLTAVLGAAVLLVLAVALAGPGRNLPEVAQVASQAQQDGEAPDGGVLQEPDPGLGEPEADTPVVGPTATGPATPPGGGDATLDPAAEPDPATEPSPPLAGDTAEPGLLPPRESRDPFAPADPDGRPGLVGSTGSSTGGTPGDEAPGTGPTEPSAAPTSSPPPSPVTTPPPDTTEPTAEPATEPATEPAPGTTSPEPPPATAPAPAPDPQPEVDTPSAHIVVPGDNLWDIVEALLNPGASDAQVAVAVDELYELNRGVIGADPDLIFPGQVLELPGW